MIVVGHAFPCSLLLLALFCPLVSSNNIRRNTILPRGFPFPSALPRLGLGQVNAGKPKVMNMSLYRISPRNYTGILNMNTGNVAGDVFFGLYEMTFPIICTGQGSQPVNCQNVPILDIPGFQVYTEFKVEMDTRLGKYSECNPDPNNGTFMCSSHDTRCWYEDLQWIENFKGVCDLKQCQCPYVDNLSVGCEAPPFAGFYNTSYPAQCLKDFIQMQDFGMSHKPIVPIQQVESESDCCAACSAMSSSVCGGYTYVLANSSCGLFASAGNASVMRGVSSGYRSAQAPTWSRISHLATILDNPLWLSTQTPGQCMEGQTVGVDCFWKVVEEKRNVNSTCVNDHVISNVQKRRPECWSACPQPTNATSVCFIDCLFETLTGNATIGLPPMTSQEITTAFALSFEESDPAKGGCETVPPCPPPCDPP